MTCDRKQTEKRLKYCRSRAMIRDRLPMIFAIVNIIVVCCNLVISIFNAINKFIPQLKSSNANDL